MSRSFDQFNSEAGSTFPFSRKPAYRGRPSNGSSKMSKDTNEAAYLVSQAAREVKLDKVSLNEIIKTT